MKSTKNLKLNAKTAQFTQLPIEFQTHNQKEYSCHSWRSLFAFYLFICQSLPGFEALGTKTWRVNHTTCAGSSKLEKNMKFSRGHVFIKKSTFKFFSYFCTFSQCNLVNYWDKKKWKRNFLLSWKITSLFLQKVR